MPAPATITVFGFEAFIGDVRIACAIRPAEDLRTCLRLISVTVWLDSLRLLVFFSKHKIFNASCLQDPWRVVCYLPPQEASLGTRGRLILVAGIPEETESLGAQVSRRRSENNSSEIGKLSFRLPSLPSRGKVQMTRDIAHY